MVSTKRRMVAVAVAVCGFAVGMAGLLNYFKYRATTDRILEQRLVFTGKSIENNIQSSLVLGLQFADIGSLPEVLKRESDGDDLITGIDVFDTEGRMLYSTDRPRMQRQPPPEWLAAAKKARDSDWIVRGGAEPAVGIAVQNHFGLTVGHLALRYSQEYLQTATQAAVRNLAVASLGVFLVAATLASLALLAVMSRLDRDVRAVETALRAGDPARAAAAARHSPFRDVLRRFVATVRAAEAQIAEVRGQLQRAGGVPSRRAAADASRAARSPEVVQ